MGLFNAPDGGLFNPPSGGGGPQGEWTQLDKGPTVIANAGIVTVSSFTKSDDESILFTICPRAGVTQFDTFADALGGGFGVAKWVLRKVPVSESYSMVVTNQSTVSQTFDWGLWKVKPE